AENSQAFVLHGTADLELPDSPDYSLSPISHIVVTNADGAVLAPQDQGGKLPELLDVGRLPERKLYRTVWHAGKRWRVVTTPLTSEETEEQIIGYLQIGRPIDTGNTLATLRPIMILAGLGAITLSLLLGGLFTRQALKPLEEIAAVALQITRADDLGRRLPDRGRQDEIGRLTTALNQTLERLERLFRAQQRFLADVSHELRTPLTAIRGNLDLIQRMRVADAESLGDMRAELERMTRLVNDLLLLARAEAGGLPIQKEPVQMDTIFLDVYRQATTLTRKLQLAVGEVDQVSILGDADRLKQLLLNLVENAIKYTPPGGTVTMSLSKADGQAKFQIADTGAGIPEEDLPHIFDRFYRVDKARTRAQGGSGLGLSIAKWIAQAHNGDILVHSELGKGSIFTVVLPMMTSNVAERLPMEMDITRPSLRTLRKGGR
ncbi:MAG: ATP-binding protein, partial [Chloroflexota bacterium]